MDITIPQLGLTMETAVLTKWLVADGDQVEADQPIAEISTDKIDHELVAPATGRISDLSQTSDDDEIPVGTVIARLETGRPA